jgi:arginase
MGTEQKAIHEKGGAMTYTRIIAPIWQGNSRPDGIQSGANALHLALGGVWLEVGNTANLQKTNFIKAKPELLEVQQRLQQEIGKHSKIALLGGDCSSDFALLAHSSRQHHPDLAVVWFDTHADLNTPASSPSGHFHGMVLRANLGETDPDFLLLNPMPLMPKQVFLAGARDFDPPELEYVQTHGIHVSSIESLRQTPTHLARRVLESGFSRLHIHLDLDVLKHFSSTGFPSAGGLEPNELIAVIQDLKQHLELVSFAVTEYAPNNPADLQAVLNLIAALEEA